MAGAILAYFPDSTLARVDAIVKRRQADRAKPQALSAEDNAEALRIAKKSGAAAANKFLASKRAPRASRVGLLQELVALGLDVHETREKAARAKAQQPGQRPKKEKRSAQAEG